MSFDILKQMELLESKISTDPNDDESRWLLAYMYKAMAEQTGQAFMGDKPIEYLDTPVRFYKKYLALEANRIKSIPDGKPFNFYV